MSGVNRSALPGFSLSLGYAVTYLSLLVLNRNGDLFLPPSPPAWATAPGFASKVETMLAEGGQELETGNGGQVFTSATPVSS